MNAAIALLRARYARLTRRERGLTIGAALAVIVVVGNLLFVAPALRQRGLLERQMATQREEHETLRASMAALGQDRNAALRTQLDALQAQLRATDREFGEIRNGLVQPQNMGALLQSLLTEHRGLQLLGLRSLPVTALGAAAADAKSAGPGSVRAAAPLAGASNPGMGEAWLFRHGVEIRVQGSYGDMVGYLQALENLPRRVHWGHLEIDARPYPKNVLTVTIYTVSLDRSWWVL